VCGIAGIAGDRDEALALRMTRALAHRGPDAEAFYHGAGVSLGHRRLSIIDLAGGAQPMGDGTGRYHLVFNGEVYNFQQLRLALEAKGHAFQTRSDTESVLHACIAHGAAAPGLLRGMFAFAFWDGAERRLLLARDPIGIKPLYYAVVGDRLLFGSEMKAILACPEVNRALDPQALDDYLGLLYTAPPRTIFQGIRELPPGHLAEWQDGELRIRRYWRLDLATEERTEEAWLGAVEAALRESIDGCRISDVPIGAYLSGGLDSATIVARMAESAGQTVNTFTVGFAAEGARYDESAQARALAAHFGTVHHPLRAEADILEVLPEVVRAFDSPFGNPTALLSFLLAGAVREHVKVVLSGDGGDEAFGGYPRYFGMQWAAGYSRLPHFLRARVLHPLAQCLPESTSGFHALRRIREFAAGGLLSPADRYAAWVGYYNRAERHALYTPEMRGAVGAHDAFDFIRGYYHEASAQADSPAAAMYTDIHTFLPCNVLQYGDRTSMAHGLEARVPFADHHLIQTLARIPSALKLKDRRGKYLMRRLLAPQVPPEVSRRPKLGFNPPMGVWLNTTLRPLAEEALSAETLARRGLFQHGPVAAMLADHRGGRRDYTWHLWALIALEAWMQAYLD